MDEAQVANGVLVGLKEKLGSINGGDDGALEAIKETLLETGSFGARASARSARTIA